MLLESARSLKAEVLQTIIDPYATAISAMGANVMNKTSRSATLSGLELHPLGLSASALKLVPHRTVALGISRGGQEFRLALRIQRHSLVDGPLIERLTKAARGEVDIRLVGPIEKRAVNAVSSKKLPVKRRPPAKAKAKPLSLIPWYQTNVRPLLIGASIAHEQVTAGTLGAFVGKNDRVFMLSNNHVLANENRASAGDAVLQRAPYDGGTGKDRVAALSEWIPLGVDKTNALDAGIADVTSSGWDGTLLKGLIKGADRTLVGVASEDLVDKTLVYKIGRTTGPTEGRVSAFDLSNIVVGYDIGSVRFDGVVEIESTGSRPFSAGGDSGSLVVNEQMEAVALVFAGSDTGATYATPIATVLDAFGVHLLV